MHCLVAAVELVVLEKTLSVAPGVVDSLLMAELVKQESCYESSLAPHQIYIGSTQ